jgi:cytochrome c551/c552
MSYPVRTKDLFRVISAAIVVGISATAFAGVDAEAAKGTARQNNRFKCHSADKEKDGPSFSKVAAKYRGQADAEQRLITISPQGKKQSSLMVMRKITRLSRPRTWPKSRTS